MKAAKSLLVLVVFAAGAAGGVLAVHEGLLERWLGSPMPPPDAPVSGESALEHAAKHLDPTYVCPMHPQIVRSEPGNCPICGMQLVLVEQEPEEAAPQRKVLYYRHPHNPQVVSDVPKQDEMGMDFVPVYDDGSAHVRVSPEVLQNLGVRTAKVERGRLWRRIDTVGYVAYDETRLSHIHVRTEGWIEHLYVVTEGERVKKGDPLFDVYSPALVNAQDEYLQARSSGNQTLMRASAERLAALGVSAGQIRELEKSGVAKQRLTFYAPQDGILASLNAREGMYLKLATEVMSLVDLASVWVHAEVFERNVDWVEPGQAAEVQLAFVPGRNWEGEVDYVYPSLNPKTRTLRVRMRFPNPGELLKPNMYARVTIFSGAKADVLSIPREALIRTGREERVILSLGEGRFAPRKVVSGLETGDRVEILGGLDEGDEVVTSGQFLIDSEASLKASLKRMQAPKAGAEDDT